MEAGQGLSVSGILGLSISGDSSDFLDLASPGETSLSAASASDLLMCARHLQAMLSELATSGIEPWTSDPVTAKAELETRTGSFWTVLRSLATYYSYCLYRYAEMVCPEAAADIIVGLDLPDLEPCERSLLPMIKRASLLAARDSLLGLHICALSMMSAAVVDGFGFDVGDLPESYDSDLEAIAAFKTVSDEVNAAVGELSELNQAHMRFAFSYREASIKKRHKRRRERSVWHFSRQEFLLLASRHDLMQEKYGKKRVERVFEQQVSSVFQSFGFTVVSARPGEAVPDLLCIARAERFTFLVDAKCSRRGYRFPVADQRAIRDYVSDFGDQLPDLPPLAFVMIVGPSAVSTVSGKLQDLEGQIGVPCRFVGADLIATMRHDLPGPLIAHQFRDGILRGNHVVEPGVVESMKGALGDLVRTYSSFVEGLRRISSA